MTAQETFPPQSCQLQLFKMKLCGKLHRELHHCFVITEYQMWTSGILKLRGNQAGFKDFTRESMHDNDSLLYL